jgi:hypothetical protein
MSLFTNRPASLFFACPVLPIHFSNKHYAKNADYYLSCRVDRTEAASVVGDSINPPFRRAFFFLTIFQEGGRTNIPFSTSKYIVR